MPKNKVLFEKGNRSSGSMECDDTTEDVWDDRKLNDAYDKALRIANAEVAKRVAMSTNTQPGQQEDQNKNKRTSKPTSSSVTEDWKPGMPCRATYEEDGKEYEAFVLRIIDDKECVVRYLGYDNCEVVKIASLKPSLGKAERQKQIKQASAEDSDQEHSVESTDASVQRKKKAPKKKSQKQSRTNPMFADMPEMPFQLPDFSMMSNGSLELPMPPPPPAAMPSRQDSEEQAVSSMLLSWYMSGYYTGLYQGMKRAKQARRPV